MLNQKNVPLNKHPVNPLGFKEIENKLLGLSSNILALRFMVVSKHNKTQHYFNLLTNQIYEMKKQIDYITVYLNIKTESNKNSNKWV